MGELGCPNWTDISEYNFSGFDYPGSTYIFHPLEWKDYIKIVSYAFAIAGALIGNVSVILTVALNRSMRTTINFYLVNLAVADLLICVFCMWVHLFNSLTSPLYIMGAFMCKFNAFTQMTCLTSSVLTLSAISCDRYIAIMYPLQARFTKQRKGAVIAIIWLISMLVSIPFLIYRKYREYEWQDFVQPQCGEQWPITAVFDPSTNECKNSTPSKQLYYTFVTVTLFFLPVAIMTTAYSLIIRKLWISELPGESCANNINIQHRSKKKVVKMVCVVLAAFILCWTPLQIIVLYSQYGHDPQKAGELPSWFSEFSYFATYIAFTNSTLNPLIYGGYNKNFRKGLCAIFRCGCRRESFRRPRPVGRTITATSGSQQSYFKRLRMLTKKSTLSTWVSRRQSSNPVNESKKTYV